MLKEIFSGLNAFADHLFTKMTGMTLEDFSYGGAGLSEADLSEEVKTVEKKYDRRLFLKIKLKNLVDEARMIQGHENRLKVFVQWNKDRPDVADISHAETLIHQMAAHRRTDIRDETRATLLAYGFIRGRKYEQIERPGYEPTHVVKKRIERVAKMVHKYSTMGWNPADAGAYQAQVIAWMGLDYEIYKKAA